MNEEQSPFHLPIDGTLDLHHFQANDTKEIVEEFVLACLEKKIYSLRIVHGKGIGVKRKIVQNVLKNSPHVASFRYESGNGGEWGATVVDLLPGD